MLLLRGVNVGGRHPIAMADLRELLTDAGFGDVVTHGQSGNVILDGDGEAASVAARASRLIGERFGFEVPVSARTAAQLRAVLELDPLTGAAQDAKRYVVTFLQEAVSQSTLRRLAGLATADERLHAHGCELYTHHPRGQARSKLAAALTGAQLGPSATARNWSTVTTLSRRAGCG